MIIEKQILSNKRSKSFIYSCYLKKMEITLYCVVLMVYIFVDLLLLCLANIILHFLILLEEYNSSNRLNYNSKK